MDKHQKRHIAFFSGGIGLGVLVGMGTMFNTLLSQVYQTCADLISVL